MSNEICIALETTDRKALATVWQKLAAVDNVKTVELNGRDLGERPHIVFTFATNGTQDVAQKVMAYRGSFPEAAIFVVAEAPRPDHIIEAMKSGAAEFFIQPIDDAQLQAAVERVRIQVGRSTGKRRGTLYSFISAKGGLGATVLAANTAAALAMQGGSVALIDLSLQSGDSSVLLDLRPKTTIADIYKSYERLDMALFKGTMQRHLTGLDFLAAPTNPEESIQISGEHVDRILHLSKLAYETSIVDCSSMFVSDCSIEAFKASEKIFIVTDLSVPAIRNASRLVKLMPKIGIDPRKVEIVVNRFIKDKVSIHDIEKNLNKSVFWLFPNDYDFTITSINKGIPIVKHNPAAGLAKNIADFAKKLTNPTTFENYRGAKGLFGKAL